MAIDFPDKLRSTRADGFLADATAVFVGLDNPPTKGDNVKWWLAAIKETADAALPKSGGTLTGKLTLDGAPTNDLHASTKKYVDDQVSSSTSGITQTEADKRYLALAGGTLTGLLTLSGVPTADLHSSTKKYVDDQFTKALAKAGGTMTGKITLDGAPTSNLHAATKKYVDDQVSGLTSGGITQSDADSRYLTLTGGTLTGLLSLSGLPTSDAHAATKKYVDDQFAKALPKSGGTMTGLITLSGAPTANLHAVTKKYVDDEDAKALPKAGGTMTGSLTLSGAPTSNLHAATKKYVDDNAGTGGSTILSGTRSPEATDGVDGNWWIESGNNGSELAIWQRKSGAWSKLAEANDRDTVIAFLQHLTRDLHLVEGVPTWSDAGDSEGDIYTAEYTAGTEITVTNSDFDNNGASVTIPANSPGDDKSTVVLIRLPIAADHLVYAIEVEGQGRFAGNLWARAGGHSDLVVPASTTFKYYLLGVFVATNSIDLQLEKKTESTESEYSGKLTGPQITQFIPAGGNAGEGLVKKSGTNYDMEFVNLLTAIGLTDVLVDRLKAGVAKFNSTSTYAADAMVVDSEIVWVSQQGSNTGNSPASDDGTWWVTLAAWIKAQATAGATGLTQTDGDSRYVQKAGDTMTGKLTLDGAPTADLHAASKKYVDDNAVTGEVTAGPAKLIQVGTAVDVHATNATEGPDASGLNDYFLVHLQYDRSPATDIHMWSVMKKTKLSTTNYELQMQGAGAAHLGITINASDKIEIDPTGRDAVTNITAEFYNVIAAKGDKGDAGSGEDASARSILDRLQHLTRDLHVINTTPEWSDAKATDGALSWFENAATVTLTDAEFDTNGASVTIPASNTPRITAVAARIPADADISTLRVYEIDTDQYQLSNGWVLSTTEGITIPSGNTYKYYTALINLQETAQLSFKLQKREDIDHTEYAGALTGPDFEKLLNAVTALQHLARDLHVIDGEPAWTKAADADGDLYATTYTPGTTITLTDANFNNNGASVTIAENTADSIVFLRLPTASDRALLRVEEDGFFFPGNQWVSAANHDDVTPPTSNTHKYFVVGTFVQQNHDQLFTLQKKGAQESSEFLGTVPDYLPLSGGTLTGKLTLDGAPSSNLHAATKKYVDDNAGGSSTIPSWTSGGDYTAGTLTRDPHSRVFLTLNDVTNSTTTPAQDPTNFKFLGGIQVYADSEAYPAGVFVSYDSKVYYVNTAVAASNTTKPDANNSFTELGSGGGGAGEQGPQGAFYLELRISAASKPDKPTALSYNYDDDTFSVTPNTWKLKETFTPADGERVWEVRAAIDPRNDAGKGSIDILSRLGNVLPFTGEAGSGGGTSESGGTATPGATATLYKDSSYQTRDADTWYSVTLSRAPKEDALVEFYFRAEGNFWGLQGNLGPNPFVFNAKTLLDLKTITKGSEPTQNSNYVSSGGSQTDDIYLFWLAGLWNTEYVICRYSDTEWGIRSDNQAALGLIDIREKTFGSGGGSGGSGAYKHYETLPDADNFEVNDLIEFAGHSMLLQESHSTADTFSGTTGTADVHEDREVINEYIGVANVDARDVFAVTGLWNSNPGNEISYIMERNGTVEVGILRSAYRAAKGSNEAAGDNINLRMTINSTTETIGLQYVASRDYTADSYGYREGIEYLVFAGSVTGGGNFVLQDEGEGQEFSCRILNAGETANLFTHTADTKHWILYHETDAIANEITAREALQKVNDAIIGLNAVQSRVRGLDFDFSKEPKATVTIDKDTVIDGRKDPSWSMDITDVEAQNDILVIEWENFDSIEYTREHALPGSTDAAGRMYIHLSDELLHQNTAYDFLGRSVNPLRVNNGDGTFTNVPTTHGAGISIHRTSTGFQVQITPTHAEFDSSTNVNNLQPPENFSMTIKLYGQESLAALDGQSLRQKIDDVEDDVAAVSTQLGGFTLEVLTEAQYTALATKDPKKLYFTY